MSLWHKRVVPVEKQPTIELSLDQARALLDISCLYPHKGNKLHTQTSSVYRAIDEMLPGGEHDELRQKASNACMHLEHFINTAREAFARSPHGDNLGGGATPEQFEAVAHQKLDHINMTPKEAAFMAQRKGAFATLLDAIATAETFAESNPVDWARLKGILSIAKVKMPGRRPRDERAASGVASNHT